MLSKRIIPCLDVKNGRVVKGVRFRNHTDVGDIVELAQRYCLEGADELVFYDITASSDDRSLSRDWVRRVAQVINIPFCVAGGIRTIAAAEQILAAGADKVSINSPALENPTLINDLVAQFGQQCIVIGIDSYQQDQQYTVYQYTGDTGKTQNTQRLTRDWLREVQDRGAGEIVLNCMNQDGVRQGYDINQLQLMRGNCRIPLIASGGAGNCNDFYRVFNEADADGALAASVFHHQILTIPQVKSQLKKQQIEVRL
jgi:cyclase